jgi:hypothetical protein
MNELQITENSSADNSQEDYKAIYDRFDSVMNEVRHNRETLTQEILDDLHKQTLSLLCDSKGKEKPRPKARKKGAGTN